MIEIVVIGTGKMGTTLGSSLVHSGYSVCALFDLDPESAKESREIIGTGRIAQSLEDAAGQGNLIIISVPDDRIADIIKQLAALRLDWKGRMVWHCSGLHSSRLLSPLRKLGALACSVHPVISIPGKKSDPSAFSGTFFSLEGEQEAVDSASEIICKLGGIPFPLPAESKIRYHTACSIASNFIAVIMETAIDLLENAGIPPEKIKPMLTSLAQGTLQNVNNLDMGEALTGPIVRGDFQTVAAHLNEIKTKPEAARIYRSLALGALRAAERQGRLNTREKLRLRALLEDK